MVGQHRIDARQFVLLTPIIQDGRRDGVGFGELARQRHEGRGVGTLRQSGRHLLVAAQDQVELGVGQHDGTGALMADDGAAPCRAVSGPL